LPQSEKCGTERVKRLPSRVYPETDSALMRQINADDQLMN